MIMNTKGSRLKMERVFAVWGLSLVGIAAASCGLTAWLGAASPTIATDPAILSELRSLRAELSELQGVSRQADDQLAAREELGVLRQALYKARAEAALARLNARDERAAKETLALSSAVERARAVKAPEAPSPDARLLLAELMEHMRSRPRTTQLAEHLSWTVRRRALVSQANEVEWVVGERDRELLLSAAALLRDMPEPSWNEEFTAWSIKHGDFVELLKAKAGC